MTETEMRLSKVAEGRYQSVIENGGQLQFAQVVAMGPLHRRHWEVFVNSNMTADLTMKAEDFCGSSLKECREWLAKRFAA